MDREKGKLELRVSVDDASDGGVAVVVAGETEAEQDEGGAVQEEN
jgi:hypothetical protein